MVYAAHKNQLKVAIPLNKHIAQSGICARRKAALLIKDGQICVNGLLVKDPGYRVTSNDTVVYQKRTVRPAAFLYILLNKPRHVITTVSDEQGRKAVLDLLPTAIARQVYPIGRLDKDTGGLLLLTNDGALGQRMSHPRYVVQKTYHVTLDRPVPNELIEQIRRGIRLDDGMVRVDQIYHATATDPCQVIIVLHSGKNKIIKRLFSQFSFWVKKLDRPSYAGLTTKGLARGEWRHCTSYEINALRKQAKI